MKTLLALVTVIGVGTVVATIIVGTHTFDGTVVKDPYEASLRWDAARRARQESGWALSVQERTLRTGSADLVLSIRDRAGGMIDGAAIDIKLTRPFTAKQDQYVHATPFPDGTYHAVVRLPQAGGWDAQVTVRKDGTIVMFEEPLQAVEQDKRSP